LTYYLLYLAFPFETQTDEEDKGAAMIENNDFSSAHVSGSESASGDEKIMDPETFEASIPVGQNVDSGDRKSHRFFNIV
jgi:hypothetical protein